MTRKDFELIAAAVAEAGSFPASDPGTVRTIAWVLAGALSTTNPRFDAKRFVKACGVELPGA